MARIVRKVRRLFSTSRWECTKTTCLLMVAIICVVKIVIVLPVLFIGRHTHTNDVHAWDQDSATMSRATVFSWWPETSKIGRVLRDLNLTREEAAQHLPLTLQGDLLLNSPNICCGGSGAGAPVDVLFMVHTAPLHFSRRLLMRNTIAAERHFLPFKVRAVYLLGRPEDTGVQDALQSEHAMYEDTVQGDFLDTYHNLSHKGVLGYRWVTSHCPQARHVVKLDDDVFFDTYKMLLRYRGIFQGHSRSLFCNVLVHGSMPIYRHGTDNKWAVDDRQFHGMDTFPYDYCSGMAVILSGDLVPALYRAAFFSPVFWIDDVYLFGILPYVAGNVTMMHLGYKDRYLDTKTESAMACMKDLHYRCSVLATVCYTIEDWETMWNITINLHVDKSWRLPFLRLP